MKKIFCSLFAAVTMMCAVECLAQTDFWVWQNGQYTKFEKADSVTFVDPEAVTSNIIEGHEYVDMGLPSGLKWATCNVGASKPTEYGDLFAWGETTPKERSSWETYKWCNGSENTLTKYCTDSLFGTVDSLSTLLSEDDAATANWGSGWRMPTKEDFLELWNNSTEEWTTDFNGSGVAGYILTSVSNGNTIFFPAAPQGGVPYSSYWSSSSYLNMWDSDSNRAWTFYVGFNWQKANESGSMRQISSDYTIELQSNERCIIYNVRAVVK